MSVDNEIYKLYRRVILESDIVLSEKRRMTPEELHNFKALLLECKRSLAIKSPYLYRVLDHLHVVPTFDERIKTMAVDRKNNIYINPDFAFDLESRNKDMVTGVLAHEVLHHENRTFSRQEWRDGQLWNIATDFIMNRDLIIDEFVLPAEGCIPISGQGGSYTVRVKPPNFKVDEYIDITNATCEYLYNRLVERLAPPPAGTGEGEEEGEGEGKGKPGEGEGEGEGEGKGKPGKGKGKGKPGGGGGGKISIIGADGKEKSDPFDTHLEGDEVIESATDDPNLQPNDGDPEELENELIKAKEEANIATEIEQDRFVRGAKEEGGGIGRRLERQEALNRGNINWRSILKDHLFKSVENNTRTYARLNKRSLGGGRVSPGTKPDMEKPEIVIALDSSASISNKTLITFLEEVLKITRDFEEYSLQILIYSDEINDNFVITPDTRQKIVTKLRSNPVWKAQGNRESCIKEWLDKKGMRKLDLFILFTDGGVNSNSTLPYAAKTFFMVLKGNPTDLLTKLNPNGTIVWVNIPNSHK